MNVLIRVELQGIKKALRDLKKFQKPERVKLLIKAMRAAGNTFLKAFRKEAKKNDRTGTLRKSLSMKQKYYKNSDTLIIVIGIKSWFKGSFKGKTVIPHKYAHLLMGGHRGYIQKFTVVPGRRYMVRRHSGLVVLTNRSGRAFQLKRKVGPAKGNPFISRVVYSKQSEAIAAAKAVVAKGFNK